MFRYSFMVIVFIVLLFSGDKVTASTQLTEETVKNFTYRMEYSGREVTLKDGEYKSPLKPGNEEDMDKYIHVRLEKYFIDETYRPSTNISNISLAVVVLSENSGGSGTFYQITAIVKDGEQISQTNSIILGDRVEIKDLKVRKGDEFFMGRNRDRIILSILKHRESDPSCCPSKLDNMCFTLVRDESRKIKLLTCEEADENYPLPIVKKPAVYLYPEKKQKIEVILNPKGRLTKTIPSYENKWVVTADTQGHIDGKYPYLFYEAELTEPVKLPEEGWIVSKRHIETWMDTYLPKLGLKVKEIKDFKEYWLGQLNQYPYYEIRVLDQDFLDKNMQILINPKPDSIIRLIFYFKGTYDSSAKIKEPIINTPIRKGFTVVEWGGILEDSDKSDVKHVKYSFFPNEKGILVLRSLNIEDHKLRINVNSNGCTDKNSINFSIVKTAKVDKRVPHYEITFERAKKDNCKAIVSEGVVLEYDIKKEFQIEMPYTLSITNPIMPFTKNDPYFMFGKVRSETVGIEEGKFIGGAIREMINMIRKDLKYATLYAINQEIEKYKKRGEMQKIEILKKEIDNIVKIKDEEFPVPEKLENSKTANATELFNQKNFGPIIPCEGKEVEIIWDKEYSIGDILNVKGMTKSGPFYHIAGIREEIKGSLIKGNVYKAVVCLVYKREYFGFIPNYYVYLADIESNKN